ncbi:MULTISPECIES: hypothetical protein [unclassified Microbacterium]|uniref:hypothetical protein n=1 Tax=unclassified Microbacterium TaxID=2609290 RepID=UPI00300FBFEB
MSGPTWTPAPRPGLIPLHPLGFGTLLGKAFAALRHNPKVLFGFAVVVQLVVVIVTAALLGAVMVGAFSRLNTLRQGSDEFLTILIGSTALVAVAGIAISLGSVAFSALVQGVVASDVAAAVLGDKATLGALWRRVRPVAWRLIGYALLLGVAVSALLLLLAAVTFGGIGALGGYSEASLAIATVVAILAFLGALPLGIWLNTKLLLVPSVLVLERATIRGAIVRSWRLTRGRFWVAFGVTALIGLIMGLAAQVVGMPASMLSSLFIPVIAPTGTNDASAIAGFVLAMLVPQLLIIVIQAIAAVVQATGATLVYLDCRMRHEGLDQDLLAAVERRQAGQDLGSDPFAVDPSRAVTAEYRPLQKTVWDSAAAPYPGPAPFPAGTPYPPAPGSVPPGSYPPAPGSFAPSGSSVPPYATPAPPAAAPAPAAPPAAPAPPVAPLPPTDDSPWAPRDGERRWTAPGSDGA